MEQIELLSKLPLPAVLMFGATLAVIFYVRHYGMEAGKKSSGNDKQSKAEVAAMIVDPTALNHATDALKAHTAEAVNMRKSFERGTEKICDAVDRLSDQIDELEKEMIRRKA